MNVIESGVPLVRSPVKVNHAAAILKYAEKACKIWKVSLIKVYETSFLCLFSPTTEYFSSRAFCVVWPCAYVYRSIDFVC